MLHVPYRGGAAAITDLLGQRVQVYFSTIADAMEHIKAGDSSDCRSFVGSVLAWLRKAGVDHHITRLAKDSLSSKSETGPHSQTQTETLDTALGMDASV
jgi:hypothetical protein